MNEAGAIHTGVSGSVGFVQISRRAKLNSLSLLMWEAIPDAVAALTRSPDVRLVALEGVGGTFSTGADLRDVMEATGDEEAMSRYCELVGRALMAVARTPVPTVALVEGAAVGGGAELALAADVRVMASTARLALPLARLGVVPDRLTTRRLLTLAGPGTARRLLLEGGFMEAEECLRRGLADRVVEPGALHPVAHDIAQGVAKATTGAIAAIKEALDAEEGIDGLDGLDGLTYRMQESFRGADLRRSAVEFLRG